MLFERVQSATFPVVGGFANLGFRFVVSVRGQSRNPRLAPKISVGIHLFELATENDVDRGVNARAGHEIADKVDPRQNLGMRKLPGKIGAAEVRLLCSLYCCATTHGL